MRRNLFFFIALTTFVAASARAEEIGDLEGCLMAGTTGMLVEATRAAYLHKPSTRGRMAGIGAAGCAIGVAATEYEHGKSSGAAPNEADLLKDESGQGE